MTSITKFSSDSGVIGDGITNDSTLLLSGTATANSTVNVYDATALLGSATANSSGAWSFTTGTLSNGAHSFTAATSTTTSTSATGFPDASTTGVRAGVTLTPTGDITISTAGAVVSGLDITGNVIINAPNVTLVDCKVTGNVSLASTGAVVEYCTVVGKNTTDSIDVNPNGIAGQGASTTIKNCDISGSENGIWLEANGAVIEKNYIHNLFSNNGNPDPHIDGIQVPGTNIGAAQSQNAIISGNNIDLDNNTANSCFTSMDALNFEITNNRFSGGSYVLYFEGNGSGSQVVNNVFAQYMYGYSSGQAETAQSYSGNVTDKGVALVQSNTVQDLVPTSGTASTSTSSVTTDTSVPLLVTVDTKAPDAPTIASHVVNSGNQVMLSGNAEANSTIKVFDGVTQVGTAKTASTGVWSVTTSALSAGSHALTAKATDAAGNLSAGSPPVDALISTTAPASPKIVSFSVDSGVIGDHVTKDNALELKGSAAANSTITVYDGSTKLGTTSANSSGGWDYITSVLADAKHLLTATVTDASGHTSAASAALTVTIDTQAPAAPKIVSDTVNGAKQVVLSGTAEASSTIKVYDGTAQVGTSTTDVSGMWSLTTSALSAGTHVLTAKATDIAGNVSAASSAVDPVIASGSGAGSHVPKISAFSTDTGKAGDHVTGDNTISLSGVAVPQSTVKVYDGTSLLGTTHADAGGLWKYTTEALHDGMHKFSARDTVSGVTSAASTPLTLTVDTHAPKAPVLLFDSIDQHGSTVTGTAEAGSTVKVYDGSTQLGSAKAGANGHWSLTAPELNHGSHSFFATATDVAGNTSAHSQMLKFSTGAQDAVEISNVQQHWDHSVTIKGTADPLSQVKLYDGAVSAGTVTANASGHWSIRTPELSDKMHAFAAQQGDNTCHVVGTRSGEAILGSSQSDKIVGTNGNDTIVGRGGSDTFVFAPNFGHDIVKDFAARGPTHDTVQFEKSVFDSFASVLSHATQSSHDVVISAGSDTLTLKNTKLGALDGHDFHFA